jgi:dTDP-glucose 4,6-dehydratase
MSLKLLLTGGAGFVGSALVRHCLRDTQHQIVNIDALTYAAHPAALEDAVDDPRYVFEHVNICDADRVRAAFSRHQPDRVIHLAAETHVDRSIDSPEVFVASNVNGTFAMLEAARQYWHGLRGERRDRFRFHHVSTDEVYGPVGPGEKSDEHAPYCPSSPYAASKAASDHLARAWGRTYGLPVLVTACGNNFGPYQYPEKLIPLMILSALRDLPLPIYGDGMQVRDWIHVDDHVEALLACLERGTPGRTYNISAGNLVANLDLVHSLCEALDRLAPRSDGQPHRNRIEFVQDRPGHDRRYAIDATRISSELDWHPKRTFETALEDTVAWYIAHQQWSDAAIECRRGLGS